MRDARAWTILVLLLAVSIVARSLAGLRVDGLWIVPDEMVWGALGRSLWEDGSFSLFGAEAPLFGVVYPAIVGGPLVLAGLEPGYDALKVVQALVMSLAAVPVFLWARKLAGEAWALVAAALTLAVPGLLYTALVLSEVVFYPVMVLAVWALAEVLETPTRRRQALFVAAVVLAVATRLQALVLPLVFVTAVGIQALLDRDLRTARRLWPATAVLAGLAGAWLAWRITAAGSLSGVLGGYAAAGEVGYSPGEVAGSTLDHAGELLLATGIFPACAVALLAGRGGSRALRAYLATAVSVTLWLLVQTGAFASVYVNGLSGRYLLPLAPVLFVGLAAWLARGAPRPRLRAGLVALGALALLVTMPLRDLVVQEAAWQSPAVISLLWLRERWGEAGMELAAWGGAAGGLALFALVPRRLAWVLPALAAGMLAFSSFAATREVQQNVAFDQRNLLGGERGWIDAAADGPVAYFYLGAPFPNLVWHQLFWNEQLRRVYVLGGYEPEGGFPVQHTVRATPDGTLVTEDRAPVAERLIVAPTSVRFLGDDIASIEIREYDQLGLTLWRVDPPARLSWHRSGVRRDGDMHEPGRLTAYDCQGGRLELTLLIKESTRVELRVNRETVRVLDDIAGEEFVNTTVFPPPDAEVCLFEVIPDSLLGSTRFEFVRD